MMMQRMQIETQVKLQQAEEPKAQMTQHQCIEMKCKARAAVSKGAEAMAKRACAGIETDDHIVNAEGAAGRHLLEPLWPLSGPLLPLRPRVEHARKVHL